MKNQLYITFLFFFLSVCSSSAQTSFHTTAHKVINTDNIASIKLQLPESAIEIKTTNSRRAIMEIKITVNAPNYNLLDLLIAKGRYDTETTQDYTTRTLYIKEANKSTIIINGKKLEETVKYVFYIPNHIRCVTASVNL